MLGLNPHQLNWSKEMELKLSNEEVKKVLLEHANKLVPFPYRFNTVLAPSFYAITGAVITYEEPTDEAQ